MFRADYIAIIFKLGNFILQRAVLLKTTFHFIVFYWIYKKGRAYTIYVNIDLVFYSEEKVCKK